MTSVQLHRLTLSNILSFGPDPHTVELGPLNVLIGPNGSGKSNFIEILNLLRAFPSDLAVPIREGGGIREWVWKGSGSGEDPRVEIDVVGFGRVLHRVALDQKSVRSRLSLETLDHSSYPDDASTNPSRVFDLAEPPKGAEPGLDRSAQSVVARASSDLPTALRFLPTLYASITVYRDLPSGPRSPLRAPQPADLPDDVLLPTGENLGLVLSAMQRHPAAYDALREAMSKFYPAFHELQFITQGNTIQVFIREKGLASPIPATRLSDGTLRYLALLAILLNPTPPTLIALEEPEVGLHPDILGELARLLEAAAARTQVVVTTHSDHLVSALSHRPEAILVTEREDQGTRLSRLEPGRLAWWLERYSLGDLWMKGEIGGTRW